MNKNSKEKVVPILNFEWPEYALTYLLTYKINKTVQSSSHWSVYIPAIQLLVHRFFPLNPNS